MNEMDVKILEKYGTTPSDMKLFEELKKFLGNIFILMMFLNCSAL